jgi:hypothetical protein
MFPFLILEITFNGNSLLLIDLGQIQCDVKHQPAFRWSCQRRRRASTGPWWAWAQGAPPSPVQIPGWSSSAPSSSRCCMTTRDARQSRRLVIKTCFLIISNNFYCSLEEKAWKYSSSIFIALERIIFLLFFKSSHLFYLISSVLFLVPSNLHDRGQYFMMFTSVLWIRNCFF